MNKNKFFPMLFIILYLSGCTISSNKNVETSEIEQQISSTNYEEMANQDAIQEEQELSAPSKEDVLLMRQIVLENMSDENIQFLTSTIKKANLIMEHAYFYNDLFKKLEDKNNLYWNYFDSTGEIVIGRAYDGDMPIEELMEKEGITEEEAYSLYGTTTVTYNDYDAKAFADLLRKIQGTVNNADLQNDLQKIIDETETAAETHEVEHVINIYKLLHDMDYYLLRYAPDDVGPFVDDTSTIMKYYGVLSIYNS